MLIGSYTIKELFVSLHVFVTKSHNISLWELGVCTSIDSSVGRVVFWQVDLGLVVNAEVGKLGLG